MRNPLPTSETERRTRDLLRSLPEIIGACDDVSKGVFDFRGALNGDEKHLIAVSLAVASRCDRSVQKWIASALDAGVTPRKIVDCIGVTILMGGDIADAYAPQALAFLEACSVPEQLELARLRRPEKANYPR